MEIYSVFVWILLTEIRSSSTDGIEAHGYSGKHVTISCQHSWAWSNRKYFCRDPCNDDDDVLVSSDRSPNGRFSLRYHGKGEFTVTIVHLKESDSGIYWCGVDRVGLDTYEKVYLSVTKEITATTEVLTTRPLPASTRRSETSFTTSNNFFRSSTFNDITHSSSVKASVNISLYFVGGLIAIIILVCVLVAVCQYWKMVKKTEGLLLVIPVYHKDGKEKIEEADVYENDLLDVRNRKQMKSKDLKSEVQKSRSHSVYENVELKPGNAIYGNL